MCPIISRYPIRAIVACRILFIKTLFTYFNTKITIIIYHHPLDQIILDFHVYVQIVHDPWAMSTQNALRFYRKKNHFTRENSKVMNYERRMNRNKSESMQLSKCKLWICLFNHKHRWNEPTSPDIMCKWCFPWKQDHQIVQSALFHLMLYYSNIFTVWMKVCSPVNRVNWALNTEHNANSFICCMMYEHESISRMSLDKYSILIL